MSLLFTFRHFSHYRSLFTGDICFRGFHKTFPPFNLDPDSSSRCPTCQGCPSLNHFVLCLRTVFVFRWALLASSLPQTTSCGKISVQNGAKFLKFQLKFAKLHFSFLNSQLESVTVLQTVDLPRWQGKGGSEIVCTRVFSGLFTGTTCQTLNSTRGCLDIFSFPCFWAGHKKIVCSSLLNYSLPRITKLTRVVRVEQRSQSWAVVVVGVTVVIFVVGHISEEIVTAVMCHCFHIAFAWTWNPRSWTH